MYAECSGCSTRRSGSPGDWAVKRPDLEPAGWAFEFANDLYPDIDDTAEVVLALRRIGDDVVPGTSARRSSAASRWNIGMQSRDGGWGAFDADNTRQLIEKLPFCDFGAVIDPPSADVTAHVVEMLAERGLADSEPAAARRAVAARRAGARRLVVRPLGRQLRLRHGRGRAGPGRRRAVARLARRCGARSTGSSSTRTPTAAGARTCAPTPTRPGAAAATSTASQTAWALLALLAADPELARGRAAASAGWSRPSAPTAAGTRTSTPAPAFPGDFYINYELYRLVFPLSALGRYLQVCQG